MKADNFDVEALLKMRHSPVRNYVIPGLTSWLIGSPSAAGTMRLFENERDHQESICPHSHRFDFQAWVLRGRVTNRIWSKYFQPGAGDMYRETTLRYRGEIGCYETVHGDIRRWSYRNDLHEEGECYSMRASEIHSIFFSRGALVLFFEGPTISNSSIVLEPYANGETIPTFKTEPWMFRREAQCEEGA